jgi:hypothetical protein
MYQKLARALQVDNIVRSPSGEGDVNSNLDVVRLEAPCSDTHPLNEGEIKYSAEGLEEPICWSRLQDIGFNDGLSKRFKMLPMALSWRHYVGITGISGDSVRGIK